MQECPPRAHAGWVGASARYLPDSNFQPVIFACGPSHIDVQTCHIRLRTFHIGLRTYNIRPRSSHIWLRTFHICLWSCHICLRRCHIDPRNSHICPRNSHIRISDELQWNIKEAAQQLIEPEREQRGSHRKLGCVRHCVRARLIRAFLTCSDDWWNLNNLRQTCLRTYAPVLSSPTMNCSQRAHLIKLALKPTKPRARNHHSSRA